MKTALSFILGWIFGSIALLLFLQMRGRLMPPAPKGEPRVSIANNEQPMPPVLRPKQGGAPMAVNAQAPADLLQRGEVIAIPVRGVDRAQLRGTFADARSGGRSHHAMDIHAPRGTPVLAAVDGSVRKLLISRAGGLTIYEFDTREKYVYYYAHLDSYAAGLAEGKKVRQGEVIGYVGSSGNANPAGPHLHFSIGKLPPTLEWHKGSPIDPHPVLLGRGVSYE